MEKWKDEYPRPQLKRDSFYSLNGEWLLNGEKINVPFPPEALLSNYNKKLEDCFSYEKTFHFDINGINDEQVILHFGAVDQICTVILNDIEIGKHEGGYLPFCFDITKQLKEENVLIVKVKDDLSHVYPYGKQRKDRGGMWYTPVSGIWQTVWMEKVPKDYIEGIKIVSSMNSIHLHVETTAYEYKVIIREKEIICNQKDVEIQIDDPHLWSVEDPYLYSMIIETNQDHVESYFALREISVQNIKGHNRICLNNKPIFLHGVLDQGYFHDGLYLPKDPIEYKRDILRMKELGFNTLRKHIKIEPETFYYYCDKCGMIVVQDMVNNGGYNKFLDTVLPNVGIQYRPDSLFVNKEYKNCFKKNMIDTLNHLHNHPCIVVYTIFNEGWGQCCSDEMYEICKTLDPTRLYDSTSGWFKQSKSDFDSLHVYFKNKVLKGKNKVLFLSECGGFSRYIDNHVFSNALYGYGDTNSENDLTNRIIELYEKMVFPSLINGLCGCIYTQLSDVEDEINGLYTYDRKVCKDNVQNFNKVWIKIQGEIEKL